MICSLSFKYQRLAGDSQMCAENADSLTLSNTDLRDSEYISCLQPNTLVHCSLAEHVVSILLYRFLCQLLPMFKNALTISRLTCFLPENPMQSCRPTPRQHLWSCFPNNPLYKMIKTQGHKNSSTEIWLKCQINHSIKIIFSSLEIYAPSTNNVTFYHIKK